MRFHAAFGPMRSLVTRRLPSHTRLLSKAASEMSKSAPELSGLQRHAFAGAVGLAAGTTVGLVGWGGAQFIIPGMTHPLMAHSQLAATGISLCSLSVGTMASSVKFLSANSSDILTAATMAIPAMASARLGARLASRMRDDVLQLCFNGASVLLIPTHFFVQQRRKLLDDQKTPQQRSSREDGDQLAVREVAVVLQHIGFGCISGLLSAIMGVGGLPITMSYLTLYTSLPHHHVQGTAVLSVAPSAVISAASRWDVIPPATAAIVTAGAMTGATIGASIALRTSEERLRDLYMLSLALLGGRSVVAASRNLVSIWRRRAGG